MRYSVLALVAVTASPMGGASQAAAQQAPLVVQQAPQPQQDGNVLKQGTPIHLATDTDPVLLRVHVGDRIEREPDVEFHGRESPIRIRVRSTRIRPPRPTSGRRH